MLTAEQRTELDMLARQHASVRAALATIDEQAEELALLRRVALAHYAAGPCQCSDCLRWRAAFGKGGAK